MIINVPSTLELTTYERQKRGVCGQRRAFGWRKRKKEIKRWKEREMKMVGSVCVCVFVCVCVCV